MSLHKFINPEGRMVHWGLDLPTGGFFYLEFFTEGEMRETQQYEEIKSRNEHMTLTKLVKEVKEKFGYDVNIQWCYDDINCAPIPTAFQHMINERLGYNLQEMLNTFSTDLAQNWM